MSLKDKLEIGLKPDAPFRKSNLPEFQQDDPACDVAATPADTPSVERARKACTMPPEKQEQLAKEREIAVGDREGEMSVANDRKPRRRAAPRRTSSGR